MIACLLALSLSAPAPAADTVSPKYQTPGNYFEKNTAGLKGDVSFLLFKDRAAFDAVLAKRPPLMGEKRDTSTIDFAKQTVAAVIHRGAMTWSYKVESVTVKGTTATVVYSATPGPRGTANFASPLVVVVDQAGITKVVFQENGKDAGSAEAK